MIPIKKIELEIARLGSDKEAIVDLINRAQIAMGDNPNGGGHIFANGMFMLYIPIICLIYWFVTISVSIARARYFTKDFMSQFES